VKISENQKTSAVGDFLRGAASKLNPMEMLKGVEDTIHAIRTAPAETALQLGKEILLHPYMAIGRGIDAMKNGDIEQAAAHFNSALGAPVGGIEESAVKGATPGHRAEGLGELIGTGASAYLGAKGPAIVKATPGALKAAASTVGDVVSAAPAPSTAEVVTAFKHPLAAAGLYLKRAIPVIRESMAGGEAAPAAAPAVEPPPIPGTAPTELDDVSKSLGYGKFSKLSPAQQDIVRRLAAQAAQQGAASPAMPPPATVNPTIAPQEPAAGAVAQPEEPIPVPSSATSTTSVGPPSGGAEGTTSSLPTASNNPGGALVLLDLRTPDTVLSSLSRAAGKRLDSSELSLLNRISKAIAHPGEPGASKPFGTAGNSGTGVVRDLNTEASSGLISRENPQEHSITHPPFAETAPFSPSLRDRQLTGKGTMAEGAGSAFDAQQQAEGLTKLFKENGISANDLEKAPLEQWEGAAELAGLAKPTKEVISRTLFELRKAERASPFAEKLKAALSQP
jgi:hypothetical protein